MASATATVATCRASRSITDGRHIMQRFVNAFLALVTVVGLLIVYTALDRATAQHNHPQQDVQLHEKFYSTWFMPDVPTKSCCNLADCYPTQARFVNGQWHALRREDGEWLPIPWTKVEMNRDNPDGQNHVCAPAPRAAYPPNTVFCFSLGGGT